MHGIEMRHMISVCMSKNIMRTINRMTTSSWSITATISDAKRQYCLISRLLHISLPFNRSINENFDVASAVVLFHQPKNYIPICQRICIGISFYCNCNLDFFFCQSDVPYVCRQFSRAQCVLNRSKLERSKSLLVTSVPCCRWQYSYLISTLLVLIFKSVQSAFSLNNFKNKINQFRCGFRFYVFKSNFIDSIFTTGFILRYFFFSEDGQQSLLFLCNFDIQVYMYICHPNE